ncbi:peptide/nickel transport system ATP-binding protein [Arboricoccus pini]|uniref:Peptide/nickel transport system ATP-binding protein n=1 Tax=Arboricoccus pini TaxID=1963835 RepID=A0A212S307_9PROT|nr:ABC transporter ATP-binding protein [Arboricoccus pini]SNB79378.1 peptide/nickel transport system ATP-binding protein [Arboricoccus pini]
MSDPLLSVSNLQITVPGADGPRAIVENVSFELQRGEVLGLIGESGAGKSTIGLAALGFGRGAVRLSGGEVLLDGEDLRQMSEAQLRALRGRKVAYVAQSAAAAFNPARTIGEQVIEVQLRHGLASREAALDQARTLFAELALPDPEHFGDRYPHQASGGQLQRAMIAMAMAGRPDLVVFDEPTTALDVTTQVEVLAAMRRVIDQHGTAALYISHDLAVVAQMADRILVLRHGRMVELDTTEAILHHPREAYTQELVAARADRMKELAHAATTPLLDIRAVSAAYGGGAHKVLFDIDVSVHPGETVAIVGESGSGKSTLARVITGLLPPAEGRIEFQGKPLSPALAQRSDDDLRRIQLIHQLPDVALNPRHRVGDVISRPLSMFRGLRGRELETEIARLLALVDLDPALARRYPVQLSGGQKQRVCIARALAAEPDLMICDEVTSALDPLVAEGVQDLLLDLQRRMRLAMLFITHDLGVVRRMADRVVVMQHGRIVEQGTTSEIFTPPCAAYTQRLLDSVPEMRIGWLAERLDVLQTQPV